jgi:RNA polymerase sigma factor (sigma-70 family)
LQIPAGADYPIGYAFGVLLRGFGSRASLCICVKLLGGWDLHPAGELSLSELGRRLRPALISYFLRRVRNPADAEDLTHEVFVRLANVPLDHLRSADGYVFQVAANLLRDHGRRHKVRDDYAQALALHGELVTESLDPARIVAGRRSLASLVARLGELDDRTRELFVLYRIENVSKRDIADAYRVSISTVEKEVARATAYLTLFREDDE